MTPCACATTNARRPNRVGGSAQPDVPWGAAPERAPGTAHPGRLPGICAVGALRPTTGSATAASAACALGERAADTSSRAARALVTLAASAA